MTGDATIMLVDDEESVLGFMRELLHGWGLDVGETNFVAISGNMWQPGIYFFSDN